MTKNNKITVINMDKERHLRYGMNALIDLEAELGKPITEIEDGLSMKDMRAMFYIGLKWEDKSLKREDVGELMDDAIDNNEEGMQYLAEKLGESIQKSLGSKGNSFPKG